MVFFGKLAVASCPLELLASLVCVNEQAWFRLFKHFLTSFFPLCVHARVHVCTHMLKSSVTVGPKVSLQTVVKSNSSIVNFQSFTGNSVNFRRSLVQVHIHVEVTLDRICLESATPVT